MSTHPHWLNVEDCAQRLDLHPEVVRRWLRSGKLAGRKIGKSWRISRDAVEPFLQFGGGSPVNRILARVESYDVDAGLGYLRCGRHTLAVQGSRLPVGRELEVRVASDAIFLSKRKLGGVSARNQWLMSVDHVVVRQQGIEVYVREPQLVVSLTPQALGELRLTPGKRIVLVFKASSCRIVT